MSTSSLQSTDDYRRRFQEFMLVERRRDELVEQVFGELEAVTLQLDKETKERAREISVLKADLESEKEARRGWQDKAGTMREQLLGMEQARFVLVLIDADADNYLFNEKFLSRGLQGGQAAADKFMEKVREHLLSLAPSIEDAKTVPVIVKAYANLHGLAQACVRDKKLGSATEMIQFWIGFSRRYPLVDFVDVGSGKEEADNKLREVLGFHVSNPQCQHVLLACCNDAGYVPVLRKYAAQASLPERITLVSSGAIRRDMSDLGFRVTSIFEELFASGNSLTKAPVSLQRKSGPSSPAAIQKTLDLILASTSGTKEKPVNNSGRLRPIIRNSSGKRIDKILTVDESLVTVMKKHNLCSWHYLRADCVVSSCKRNHGYPRPLGPSEYDAQWSIARQGLCYRLRKGNNCTDGQCMYGHSTS